MDPSSGLFGAGPRLKVRVTFRLPDRMNKVKKNRIQVTCSAQETKKLHLAKTSRNKGHRVQGTRSFNVSITNTGTAQSIINRAPSSVNKE